MDLSLINIVIIVNTIISIAVLSVVTRILYAISYEDIDDTSLEPLGFPSAVMATPPPPQEPPAPVAKRKPLVIDDERALEIERRDKATRRSTIT